MIMLSKIKLNCHLDYKQTLSIEIPLTAYALYIFFSHD